MFVSIRLLNFFLLSDIKVPLNLNIFHFLKGNLPDPGKAQDFMKKFTQVLEDDDKIKHQLETLVSPTCSCKQAEGCVVRIGIKA